MKAYILCVLATFLIACNSNGNSVRRHIPESYTLIDTVNPDIIAGSFSGQKNLKIDSLAIRQFILAYPLFKPIEQELNKFYKGRGYALAWYENNRLIEQSNILYNRILHMEDNGLPLEAPYIEMYTQMMENPKGQDLVSQELMLTAQYLIFAKKVLNGIPETDSRSIQWYIPRKKINYSLLLEDIIQGNTRVFSNSLYPQYEKLRKELLRYYEIEKKGGWEKIEPDKRTYKKGDDGSTIAEVRKRLFKTGEFLGDTTQTEYDTALEKAIIAFQETNGIIADGFIKTALIKELNTPIRERIEQLIVNMERCRWLPNQTDEKYIVVNIPDFTLFAYKQDTTAFSCKVVVGKETNKTAIFRGDMKYVVFNPYWNVPESIIKKEILPEINKNSRYLEEHEREWNGGKIRQKPGAQTALGKVKFLFPNVFNIYLHDTPGKTLFSKEKRTFSHGCIRVSEPRKLAIFLLEDEPGWNEEVIDKHMENDNEKYVTLKKSIPVYVVYFTAFVDDMGRLNFRKDIYLRDHPLRDIILSK